MAYTMEQCRQFAQSILDGSRPDDWEPDGSTRTKESVATDVFHMVMDCLSEGGTISRHWDPTPGRRRRVIALTWPTRGNEDAPNCIPEEA